MQKLHYFLSHSEYTASNIMRCFVLCSLTLKESKQILLEIFSRVISLNIVRNEYTEKKMRISADETKKNFRYECNASALNSEKIFISIEITPIKYDWFTMH